MMASGRKSTMPSLRIPFVIFIILWPLTCLQQCFQFLGSRRAAELANARETTLSRRHRKTSLRAGERTFAEAGEQKELSGLHIDSRMVFVPTSPFSMASTRPPVAGLWAPAADTEGKFQHETIPHLSLEYKFAPHVGRKVWGIWDEAADADTTEASASFKYIWQLPPLTVESYERTQEIRSDPFSFYGYNGWFLGFYPAGSRNSMEDHCGLFLHASGGATIRYRLFQMRSGREVAAFEYLECFNESLESASGNRNFAHRFDLLSDIRQGISFGVEIRHADPDTTTPRSPKLLAYLDTMGHSPSTSEGVWWTKQETGWTNDGHWRFQRIATQLEGTTEMELSAASPVDFSEALRRASAKGLSLRVPQHLTEPLLQALSQDPVSDPQDLSFSARLDRMFIGRPALKGKLTALYQKLRHEEERRKRGILSKQPSSKHMVFTGSPGTGKTMVARELGRLLKDVGYLSKGHVVEVQRGDLVAGYIGQTAPKTKAMIENAAGGILFVDEAYRLIQDASHSRDFGREALEEIMSVMNDADDLVIVLAGYSDKLQVLMDVNPGLKRRIYATFEFADFSTEELAQIFVKMVRDASYALEEGMDEGWLSQALHSKCSKRLRSRYYLAQVMQPLRYLATIQVFLHAAPIARARQRCALARSALLV
eukprot:TRINITY_DN45067_c0_g1_i2.p1 TRINITY_DN45067_c0_g1~~TRINITY_DN45067_c0_g1_i2.p1  ORF type:complete len:654 (-),score=48.88 TRINITY_DN45067_c0_g1_i2:56-2017(-)